MKLDRTNTLPNQRTAHRIEEEVLLACRPLERDGTEGSDTRTLFEPLALAELGRRLAHVDQQFRECHTRLTRTDPIAAEAMQLLDAKLTLLRDVVAQAVTDKHDGPPLERVTASLSANGIGFVSPRTFDVGAMIALHLVLLPHRQSIIAHARVAQSRPAGEGHRIGLEFVELPEPDQRRLTRHILRAEINRRK